MRNKFATCAIIALLSTSSSQGEELLQRGVFEWIGKKDGEFFVPCQGKPFKLEPNEKPVPTTRKCDGGRPIITGNLKLLAIDFSKKMLTVEAQKGKGKVEVPLPSDPAVAEKVQNLKPGEMIAVKIVDDTPYKVNEKAF